MNPVGVEFHSDKCKTFDSLRDGGRLDGGGDDRFELRRHHRDRRNRQGVFLYQQKKSELAKMPDVLVLPGILGQIL